MSYLYLCACSITVATDNHQHLFFHCYVGRTDSKLTVSMSYNVWNYCSVIVTREVCQQDQKEGR